MKTKRSGSVLIRTANHSIMVLIAVVIVWAVSGSHKNKGLTFFSRPSKAGLNDSNQQKETDLPEYGVARIPDPVIIDANWDKAQWKDIKSIEIANQMGKNPLFLPKTEVKMAYNEECICLIFRVRDKFVRSVVQRINGPVYEDSAVEFFFSPDPDHPSEYFDLEINCGGTPLICYVPVTKNFSPADIQQICIAHSLPQVVYPELKKEVTWTVECKIPFRVLEQFSDFSQPVRGVCWKGNFFKTASKGSNPHYLTWAPVKNKMPNFHLPQFFGRLKFD